MDINNFQLLLSHLLPEGDGLNATESVKDKTYSGHLGGMVWQTLWRTMALYTGNPAMGFYSEGEKVCSTPNTAWASRNVQPRGRVGGQQMENYWNKTSGIRGLRLNRPNGVLVEDKLEWANVIGGSGTWSDAQVGGSWLNWPSRVLAKAHFPKKYTPVPRRRFRKLPEVWSSKESLPKVRFFVCFLVLPRFLGKPHRVHSTFARSLTLRVPHTWFGWSFFPPVLGFFSWSMPISTGEFRDLWYLKRNETWRLSKVMWKHLRSAW